MFNTASFPPIMFISAFQRKVSGQMFMVHILVVN